MNPNDYDWIRDIEDFARMAWKTAAVFLLAIAAAGAWIWWGPVL